MDLRLIYVTTKTQAEAETIANALLDEHLIACANIFPAMTSIYRWNGKKEKTSEVALIMKGRASDTSAIIERIKALHSYECPGVVSLPIEDGNHEFLQWVESETDQS